MKLSEISKVAQQVEQNPKLVLNLPKEITKDIETTYLLEDHAVFVLDNALQSPEYDDGQKTEFKNLISQVQSLMKKIEKDVPVYGPREFYML